MNYLEAIKFHASSEDLAKVVATVPKNTSTFTDIITSLVNDGYEIEIDGKPIESVIVEEKRSVRYQEKEHFQRIYRGLQV